MNRDLSRNVLVRDELSIVHCVPGVFLAMTQPVPFESAAGQGCGLSACRDNGIVTTDHKRFEGRAYSPK